ncbi:MAG: dehypoxanthine futalosine cyclase [Syntrophomonadaceae bacterium]|nr:dehypoxanthine futalosine cyclase [Syntrophomonadaceae bacterium]
MNGLQNLLQETVDGRRLSSSEALELMEKGDLLDLGQAANQIVQKKHPANQVTFVIDRNINYTNICISRCRFCAFYRERHDQEAYVLTQREIFEKIEEAIAQGATQVMLQGGLHPDLGLDYVVQMVNDIKARYNITIHSFSPPEIFHFATISNVSIRTVLQKLSEAGLDSLPGGGAEILVDRVRDIISPHKITASQWLEVMETAHYVGLASTATMMIGTVETREERIDHLEKIRSLQERTGGFRGFIPWTFCPENTDLGGSHVSALEYLRMLAIARLYLDNVNHIQGSWVTQSPAIGQLSLLFGADDLGSIMLEENVVRAAGCEYRLNRDEMIRLIRETGKIPAQRDTTYSILKVF